MKKTLTIFFGWGCVFSPLVMIWGAFWFWHWAGAPDAWWKWPYGITVTIAIPVYAVFLIIACLASARKTSTISKMQEEVLRRKQAGVANLN